MARSVSQLPRLTLSQLSQLSIKEPKTDLEQALQAKKTITAENMPKFIKTETINHVESSNCQTPSQLTKAETIPAKVLEQKILESQSITEKEEAKQEVQAAGNMQHSNSEMLAFSPSAKSSTADF